MREWLMNQAARAAHEMGIELKHMRSHGSHELGAAIFNGSAFVMYPRGTRDDQIKPPEQAHIERGREI